jgi:hypothetical protein
MRWVFGISGEILVPSRSCSNPFPRAPQPGQQSFVLPIVSQLDGEPRVTEDGDIIYVFPELQKSASSSLFSFLPGSKSSSATTLQRAGLSPTASATEIKQLLALNRISTRGALEKKDLLRILERNLPPMTPEEEEELGLGDPSMLQEREYKFSLAPDSNRFLAGGLGALNLGGALYLGNMLSTYAMYGVRLPSYFGAVQASYPFLLAYAVLFNVIPLARNFWIKAENEKIRERNKRRREWKAALAAGMGSLSRKLKAAKSMRTKVEQIGASPDDIVFDTRQSMTENQEKRQRAALNDFDKLLEKEEDAFQ